MAVTPIARQANLTDNPSNVQPALRPDLTCCSRSLAEGDCITSSDSGEECLRPSLLRRRRQPAQITLLITPHPEDFPAYQQTSTPQRHAVPSDQQAAAFDPTAFNSPSHQIPFATPSPTCPVSDAPSRSCLSPTAERDLFGSPATAVPPGFTPSCASNLLESAGLQKQLRHGVGTSKALSHITRLQRDRTHLIQQLKGHEQRQQQAELLLNDADFLQSRLKELRGSLSASARPAELDSIQPRPAHYEASLDTQPPKAETMELWQQLSSESSNSDEARQLEELQAQLSHTNQQLHTKEAEVVGLTIQLFSAHTQLDASQTQLVESAQQLESVQTELAESSQHLEAAHHQLAESTQLLEPAQQHVADVLSTAATAEASLRDQLNVSHQRAEALSSELEQSHDNEASLSTQLSGVQSELAELAQQLSEQADFRQSAALTESALVTQLKESQQQCQLLSCQVEQSQASWSGLSSQLQHAQQQLEQLSDAHVMDESTMLDQLSEAQEGLQHALASLEQSQAAQADLSGQLQQARQQLDQVSNARAMDESTMLDQLSKAHAELQRAAGELVQSREQQTELSEQVDKLSQEADKLRLEHEEAAEAHTMTEATLLDQLTETQAELERACTQVRHSESRHQEMCQQLMFARLGQADAMKAATDSKQQLSQQLQTAQSDYQTVTHELQSTKALLSTARQQLHEEEVRLAAVSRQLSQSGMDKFELSQSLQDAQTQLSHELESSTKLQAKLKKYRTSQLSLRKELESAKAEVLSVSESQAEACQQLTCVRSELDTVRAETGQGLEVQAELQEQLQKMQVKSQQAQAEIGLMTDQLADSAQQLQQSHDLEAQLAQQLQAATANLQESQRQSAQAFSDCIVLRSQLDNTAAQLEQSCSRQARYAVAQQRAASELAAERAESSRLASSLSQAETVNQALDAQLKDLHTQHRKLRAKGEQLAVRSARYDALQKDLAEAETHLAAQCAHQQVEQQKGEKVTQHLVGAANRLSQALYNLQPASPPPPPPRHAGVGLDLGSTAEQVCSLVEALLLHYGPTHTSAPLTEGHTSAASSRPVDVLRCHVAEAQARANHIVDEFESMLLVTGSHSMKEVLQIQTQAGLTESTSAGVTTLSQASACLVKKKASPAVRATPSHTRSISTSTGPPSLTTSNSGARRSVKSSATSSKENKAPTLTYVTGGQIRGARRLHEVAAARQPLKPSITSNSAASNAPGIQAGKNIMVGSHKPKS